MSEDTRRYARDVRQLFKAAQYGDLGKVQRLLRAGVPVDGEVAPGCTPLFVAAREGNCDVVRVLLDAGATVNCASGFTPLWVAVMAGRVKVVELLLSRGADPDIRVRHSGLPLVAYIQRDDPNEQRLRELLSPRPSDGSG